MDLGQQVMNVVQAEHRRVMAARERILEAQYAIYGGNLEDYDIVVCMTGPEGCTEWLKQHPDWQFLSWLPDFKPSATIVARRLENGMTYVPPNTPALLRMWRGE